MSQQDHEIRIVVAEDEALIRMDLVEMLRECGYVVVGEAGDGQTAVDLVTRLHPDVVFMDVKMPVLDGLEAAKLIGDAGIAPVVMLTAFSQRDYVARAAEAGVMSYLVKPFGRADLVPAVELAVARWAQKIALENEVADLTDRLETRKLVERAKTVLQERFQMSEPEAFRWMQKAAMDGRIGMKQVAEVVLEDVTPAS